MKKEQDNPLFGTQVLKAVEKYLKYQKDQLPIKPIDGYYIISVPSQLIKSIKKR